MRIREGGIARGRVPSGWTEGMVDPALAAQLTRDGSHGTHINVMNPNISFLSLSLLPCPSCLSFPASYLMCNCSINSLMCMHGKLTSSAMNIVRLFFFIRGWS